MQVTYYDYYGSVDEESFFGIFGVYSDSGCLSYEGYEEALFGVAWEISRAMAISATVLGALALVGTLSLSCMSTPKWILTIISILYVISALCAPVTFMMFAECEWDYELGNVCKIGPGGYLVIVAPVFYVASAILVCKNKKKPERAAPPTNVMITITKLPDGTKKSVKTTIDGYGNKTIEEIIEEPPEDLYPVEVGVETGKY